MSPPAGTSNRPVAPRTPHQSKQPRPTDTTVLRRYYIRTGKHSRTYTMHTSAKTTKADRTANNLRPTAPISRHSTTQLIQGTRPTHQQQRHPNHRPRRLNKPTASLPPNIKRQPSATIPHRKYLIPNTIHQLNSTQYPTSSHHPKRSQYNYNNTNHYQHNPIEKIHSHLPQKGSSRKPASITSTNRSQDHTSHTNVKTTTSPRNPLKHPKSRTPMPRKIAPSSTRSSPYTHKRHDQSRQSTESTSQHQSTTSNSQPTRNHSRQPLNQATPQ